ncbi:MAG: FAD-dependent oxidoreductase [Bacteroidota bacterium]
MVTVHNHQLTPATITFAEQVVHGIYLFGIPRNFAFAAGQVIGVALAEDGPRRLYSICSGEQDEEVWIPFNVIDEGYLTPRLSDLEPGDTIWITGPRGEFVCDEKPAVWIASGTGIAPFYSMLRSGRAVNKILIHGNRYLEQFHFYADFASELGNNYIRCCTGESSGDVFHGRVTAYLAEHPLPAPGLKYYLCGRAEMVVDTRDVLISKGVPFDRIISEIYF